MNRKLLLAWLVVFIVWMAGSFVVHETLLHDDYAQLPNLFRPEADVQRLFSLMLLAHVMLAGALVWIYSRGVEPTPWLPQGLRFGLAVAFLTVIPTYIIYYVVQPIPSALAVKQIVFDTMLMLVLGAVAAFMIRGPAARTM
ncbi:MAG TPA: hypothetical protein VHJ69_09120 [Gemmatimonadales bacterium]|jgi:hypothetical protein|nr:hypothetical protein [Gemmatimonadales bacterium]